MQEHCFGRQREHDVEVEHDEAAEDHEDGCEGPRGSQSQERTLALIVAAQEDAVDLAD